MCPFLCPLQEDAALLPPSRHRLTRPTVNGCARWWRNKYGIESLVPGANSRQTCQSWMNADTGARNCLYDDGCGCRYGNGFHAVELGRTLLLRFKIDKWAEGDNSSATHRLWQVRIRYGSHSRCLQLPSKLQLPDTQVDHDVI